MVNWFSTNYLKANPGKSEFLLIWKEEKETSITIKDTTIKNSSFKTLPGVLIENKLIFNDHVCKLCEKTSKKIHALAGVSNYMSK